MDTRLVIDIDDADRAWLEKRAQANGRTLEQEAKLLLKRQSASDAPDEDGLGTRISNLFAGTGYGLTAEIPELRGEQARAADFDD